MDKIVQFVDKLKKQTIAGNLQWICRFHLGDKDICQYIVLCTSGESKIPLDLEITRKIHWNKQDIITIESFEKFQCAASKQENNSLWTLLISLWNILYVRSEFVYYEAVFLDQCLIEFDQYNSEK